MDDVIGFSNFMIPFMAVMMVLFFLFVMTMSTSAVNFRCFEFIH